MMPELEMYDIFQRVNNVMLKMDELETEDNKELFSLIRETLQVMEHKLATMSTACMDMRESFDRFKDAYEIMEEEISHRLGK